MNEFAKKYLTMKAEIFTAAAASCLNLKKFVDVKKLNY